MSWVKIKKENMNDYPKTLKRARLQWTAIFTVSIFAIVLFFSIFIIRIQHTTIDARLDSRLIELTNLSQNALDLFRIQNDESLPSFLFEEGQSIQVYGPAGNLRFTIGERMPENLQLPENVEGEIKKERLFQTIRFVDKDGNTREVRTYSRVIKPKLPGVGDLIVRAGIDVKAVNEEKEIFRTRVITFLLIFPLLSFLMAYLLAGMVLQPVKENYNLLRKFSFDASHELKTPLAIIQMSTGMLLSKKDGLEESVSKKILSIENASQRMDRLVIQLLQLARAQEYNESNSAKEPVDMNQLMAELLAEYEVYAQKKAVGLVVLGSVQKKPLLNKTIIRMVIGNIVENAIKFSPENSPVQIRLEEGKTSVMVQVKDFGPGIAEDEQDRVFERFYKADQSRHDHSGSGMGLSIVREYAKKMGIKIELESEPGSGTQFSIKIAC